VKFGVPKIRFSKKLVLIVVGIFALLGGTGAAAIYIGSDKILGAPKESAVGDACTDIETMILKTPTKRKWLRKYIRMQGGDGPARIKTALRIAGLVAKTFPVDLIQINVLDAKGPDKRAQMRDRTIGAEVIIAMRPEFVPEMKQPFVARYYEGQPNEEGRFYGAKVSLDLGEVRSMMTKMKDAPDKEDCAAKPKTPEEIAKEAEAKKNEHGEKPADAGEKPAAHGEEAKPAEHGETPKEGDAAGHEPAPAKKDKGFLDSMLSMVGLGAKEEPTSDAKAPVQTHDGKAAIEDLAKQKASLGHEAPADNHPAKDAAAEGHAVAAEEAVNDEPVAEEPAPAKH
jgi:hypothetical protein